jgi:hypothetical protein
MDIIAVVAEKNFVIREKMSVSGVMDVKKCIALIAGLATTALVVISHSV